MTDSELRRLAEILASRLRSLGIDHVYCRTPSEQLQEDVIIALTDAVRKLIAERSAEVVRPGTEE